MGILSCSGLLESSLLLKDANTPGGTPRECTATATPTPQLPHWHTTALSGKQSHMCSIVCSQHPLPLRAFTPGTITPLSHYRAALPRDHPRTGRKSHWGYNPRPISCCTHRTFARCSQLWARGSQRTSYPVNNTRASVLFCHPIGCSKS